jgi:hypothetical protein
VAMCECLFFSGLFVITALGVLLATAYTSNPCETGGGVITLSAWLVIVLTSPWILALILRVWNRYFTITRMLHEVRRRTSAIVCIFCALVILSGLGAITMDPGCKGVVFIDTMESANMADGLRFIVLHSQTSVDDQLLYFYNLYSVARFVLVVYTVALVISAVCFCANGRSPNKEQERE